MSLRGRRTGGRDVSGSAGPSGWCPLGIRRNARVLALSVLYQVDLKPGESVDDIFYYTLMMDEHEVRVVRYAQKLVQGVLEHREEIDRLIGEHADNWTVARMATVDRNVLRLSLFEMKYLDDIPKNVSINEAVEIAKLYSTEKSGEFVNGVLDRIGHLLYAEKGAGHGQGREETPRGEPDRGEPDHGEAT